MKVKYFGRNNIIKMLSGKALNEIEQSMYICSASDLLFVCEEVSNNNLQISSVINQIENMRRQGISILPLTKNELVCNLFIDDEGEIVLDELVKNSKIPPHITTNFVILKPTDYSYWDSDLTNQMFEENQY